MAPLNLLLVRSLTVYDVLIGIAFVLLLRDKALRPLPRGYLVAVYVFMLAATLSAFRATHAIEALTQILQYAFIFFVHAPCRPLRGAHAQDGHLVRRAGVRGDARRDPVRLPDAPDPGIRPGPGVLQREPQPARLPHRVPGTASGRAVACLAFAGAGLRTAVTVLCIGSGYLAVWAVAASASRSAALGTLAALIVFVALRPLTPPGRRMLQISSLVVVVVAVAGVLFVTGSLPTTLEDRVERSFTPDDQSTLVGDREHLNNAAVLAFVQSPYLGSGLDNFRYVTTNYDLDATPQLPHNQWLQLMVQVGVFGAVALAVLLLMWFRDLVRAYRLAPPPDRELLWGLVAALSGVLTIFMFAPEMLDRHYWLFVALGLAVAAGVRHDNEQVRNTR